MKHGTGKMFVVPPTKTFKRRLKKKTADKRERVWECCIVYIQYDRGYTVMCIYSVYSMCCHCSGLLLVQSRHRIGREIK